MYQETFTRSVNGSTIWNSTLNSRKRTGFKSIVIYSYKWNITTNTVLEYQVAVKMNELEPQLNKNKAHETLH